MRADFEKIQVDPGESFAFREFLQPRFITPWHFHPEVELTLILASSGERFVGDSIEAFGPGDLVLLGSRLPHYWHNAPSDQDPAPEAHSLVIQFLPDFLGDRLFATAEFAPVAGLLDRAAQGVVFEGEESRSLARSIQSMQEISGGPRLCRLLDVLVRLAEIRSYRLLSSPAFVPRLDPRAGDRINQVHDYVLEHLGESITVPVVAAGAGMSPSAFCRYFRRIMGRTFTEFVNEIRIGQACRMLMESDQPVSEIAYAVGYNSLSHFNSRFRSLRGRSPRAYRREYANPAGIRPAAAPGRWSGSASPLPPVQTPG